MRSFYINPATNDIELDGSNNLKMVEGDDELLQCVMMTVSTNVNEWFLNPDHGFDWSMVQGKKVDESIAIEALYAAILQEERIASIENIEINFDHSIRKMEIDFIFTKQNGETVEGGFSV